MMKRSDQINTIIKLFSYDPVTTLLNIMNYKKITQIDVSNYLGINERNTRNYFLRKTKLNNHFILSMCCICELSQQESLELFKISGLEITLLDDGPKYFEFLKDIEKYNRKQNLQRIIKQNL